MENRELEESEIDHQWKTAAAASASASASLEHCAVKCQQTVVTSMPERAGQTHRHTMPMPRSKSKSKGEERPVLHTVRVQCLGGGSSCCRRSICPSVLLFRKLSLEHKNTRAYIHFKMDLNCCRTGQSESRKIDSKAG